MFALFVCFNENRDGSTKTHKTDQQKTKGSVLKFRNKNKTNIKIDGNQWRWVFFHKNITHESNIVREGIICKYHVFIEFISEIECAMDQDEPGWSVSRDINWNPLATGIDAQNQ